jgi:hypothetical protein
MILLDPLQGAAQGRLGHVEQGCSTTEIALLIEDPNDQKLPLRTHAEVSPQSHA